MFVFFFVGGFVCHWYALSKLSKTMVSQILATLTIAFSQRNCRPDFASLMDELLWRWAMLYLNFTTGKARTHPSRFTTFPWRVCNLQNWKMLERWNLKYWGVYQNLLHGTCRYAHHPAKNAFLIASGQNTTWIFAIFWLDGSGFFAAFSSLSGTAPWKHLNIVCHLPILFLWTSMPRIEHVMSRWNNNAISSQISWLCQLFGQTRFMQASVRFFLEQRLVLLCYSLHGQSESNKRLGQLVGWAQTWLIDLLFTAASFFWGNFSIKFFNYLLSLYPIFQESTTGFSHGPEAATCRAREGARLGGLCKSMPSYQ